MSAYNEITASNITSTYGTRLVKIPPKNQKNLKLSSFLFGFL